MELVFQEKHLLRLRSSKIQRLHSLDSSASFSSRIRLRLQSCKISREQGRLADVVLTDQLHG